MSIGAAVKADGLRRSLEQIIKFNMKMGEIGAHKRKAVPVIWGAAGIGKTSLVKQLADENTEIVDVPLAQFEETGDLHGLPRRIVEDGIEKTGYAPPVWVPTSKNKKYIILFDDYNRADIRIIKCTMQLLQNYGTISWRFPPSTTIILTGNPDDGENLVTGMDTAILTRMRHFELAPDPLLWADWAKENDIDDRIIAFVISYKEMFCPNKPGGITNPRTLTEFGEFLHHSGNLTDLDIKIHARSLLDEETAVAFDKFISGELQNLIDPKDILEGKWEREVVPGLAKNNRTDVISIILDRLYVEISDARRTDKRKAEFLEFITQDAIPKDMIAAMVSRISGHEKKREWIKDKKLSRIIIDVR